MNASMVYDMVESFAKERRQHCWLSRAHEQHQNQTRLIVASIDRLLECHFLSSSRIKFCDLFGLENDDLREVLGA